MNQNGNASPEEAEEDEFVDGVHSDFAIDTDVHSDPHSHPLSHSEAQSLAHSQVQSQPQSLSPSQSQSQSLLMGSSLSMTPSGTPMGDFVGDSYWICAECTFRNNERMSSDRCTLCDGKRADDAMEEIMTPTLPMPFGGDVDEEEEEEDDDDDDDDDDVVVEDIGPLLSTKLELEQEANSCFDGMAYYGAAHWERERATATLEHFECALSVVVGHAPSHKAAITVLKSLNKITQRVSDEKPKYRVLDIRSESVQNKFCSLSLSLSLSVSLCVVDLWSFSLNAFGFESDCSDSKGVWNFCSFSVTLRTRHGVNCSAGSILHRVCWMKSVLSFRGTFKRKERNSIFAENAKENGADSDNNGESERTINRITDRNRSGMDRDRDTVRRRKRTKNMKSMPMPMPMPSIHSMETQMP